MNKGNIFQYIKLLMIATLAIALMVALEGTATERLGSMAWLGSVAVCCMLVAALLCAMLRWIGKLTELKFTAALILISILLKMLWVGLVPNELVSDFAIYHELAEALAAGNGYTITGGVGREDIQLYLGGVRVLPYATAFRAPGTALWGGFLYKIFGVTPLVFKISNIILGTLSVILLYRIFRGVFAERVVRAGAMMYAISPSVNMASNLFCSEVLFSVLILSAGYAVAKSREYRFRWWAAAFCGLMAAGAVLVRPMLGPVLLAVVIAFVMADDWETAARKLLVLGLFFGIGLAPWTLRNWRAFHRFIPVCTDEGISLALNSKRNVPNEFKTMEWTSNLKNWEEIPSEFDKSERGYAIGTNNIRLMLQGGPAHVVKAVAMGFRDIFKDDHEILFWAQRRSWFTARHVGAAQLFSAKATFVWQALIASFYLVMLATALFGATAVHPKEFARPGGLLFLGLILVIFTATHVAFKGQTRYHFVMIPVLSMLSARGVGEIIRRKYFAATLRGRGA